MANKYWEEETAKVFQSTKNELRIFENAEKIQCYVRANTAHGVGKGTTLDLASMSVEELVGLKEVLVSAIDSSIERRQ